MSKSTQKILNQTQEIYNKIAPEFSNTRGQIWRGLDDFDKYVNDGDRILDLGCGNGRMAEVFKHKKVQYLGIDNSEELIKIAREKYKGKSWIKFEVGDVLDFAEKDNEFDLVIMIAVLHHIPNRKLRLLVLKNINRVIKPGGRLVMSNWNLWQIFGWKKKFRYWQYLWNWPEKILRGVWGFSDAFVPWKPAGAEARRYVHSFGKGETRRLLETAGFKIDELDFKAKNDNSASILRGDNLVAIAVKK